MATEIERKFLTQDASWRAQVTTSTHMEQGYLVDAAALEQGLARSSVRVRVAGADAWLNVKSVELGIERLEYEYSIPVEDARAMLHALGHGTLTKIRHLVPVDGHTFEIDEFLDDNAGLVVAELELASVDAPFPRPPWLGREVSDQPRYYNVHLMAYPWRDWDRAERAGEPA